MAEPELEAGGPQPKSNGIYSTEGVCPPEEADEGLSRPHPTLRSSTLTAQRPPSPHPTLRLLKVTPLAVTYLRDPGLTIAHPQASRLLGADY